MSYCTRCGSPVGDDHCFCSACGSPIGELAGSAPVIEDSRYSAAQVGSSFTMTESNHSVDQPNHPTSTSNPFYSSMQSCQPCPQANQPSTPASQPVNAMGSSYLENTQSNPSAEATEENLLFEANGTPVVRKASLGFSGGICALCALGAFLMWNSSRNHTGWTATTPSAPGVDFALAAPTGLHFSDEGEWMLLIMAMILLMVALASLMVIIQSSGNYFRIYSGHVEARSGGLVITRFTSRITEISNVTANPEGVNPHLSIRCKDGRSWCVLLDKKQLEQSERIMNQLIGSACC